MPATNSVAIFLMLSSLLINFGKRWCPNRLAWMNWWWCGSNANPLGL